MAWYDQAPSYHSTGGGGSGGGNVFSGSSAADPGDLPFDVHDLPPEIRLKIDEIIRNNEDLEAQMDAIDALLFGKRNPTYVQFIALTKSNRVYGRHWPQ